MECCFQDLFKSVHSILGQYPSSFFSMCLFVSMWCIHTVVLTLPLLGRNPILFYQIDQISIWSIELYTFAWRIIISFLVDETLLLRHMNLLTYLKRYPLRVEIVPSHLKQMYILFAFTWRPMLPTACARQCSRDLIRAGVFARSTRSSA